MLWTVAVVGSPVLMLSETHRFNPTVFYSTYSFAHPPTLRIKPGDRVITKTLDAGGSDGTGKQVANIGANPEIGPFYIEGAEPGDVLAVTFEKIETNRKTSFSGSALSPYTADPQALLQRQPGQAPRVNWMIDKEKGVARLEMPELMPSIMELPLRPMLGCVGVAPARKEAILSTTPGPWGGNMDLQRPQFRSDADASSQRARCIALHGRWTCAARRCRSGRDRNGDIDGRRVHSGPYQAEEDRLAPP
jgi:hypothetical protein